MKLKLLLFIVLSFCGVRSSFAQNTACNPSDQCVYTFSVTLLTDGADDAAAITVTQNDINISTLSVTSSSGTASAMIPICDMVPFYVNLDANTPVIGSIQVTVVNTFMQTIYNEVIGEEAPGSLLYIDQGECAEDMCYAPFNVQAEVIGLSAQVTQAGISYEELQYFYTTNPDDVPNGDTTPSGSFTDEPYIINCLEPQTQYYLYLREECFAWGNPGYTQWSAAESFTTGEGYSIEGTVMADINNDQVCDDLDYAFPELGVIISVDGVYFTTVYTDANGHFYIPDLPCNSATYVFELMLPADVLPPVPVEQFIDFNGPVFTEPVTVCLDAALASAVMFSKPDVSIFPNPVKEVVNINSGSETVTSIKIYDMNGRKCLDGKGSKLEVGALQAGIYLAHINTEKGNIVIKLAKE